MFQKDDYIIYSYTGVCKVKAIEEHKNKMTTTVELYYKLEPLFGSEVIYTPVNTKLFMRPVIQRDEAISILKEIPEIKEEDYQMDRTTVLVQAYEGALLQHDSRTLIKLIKGIYKKNHDIFLTKKKMNSIDQKYLRIAEDLLYSEFSIALNVPMNDVKQYVEGILFNAEPHSKKESSF